MIWVRLLKKIVAWAVGEDVEQTEAGLGKSLDKKGSNDGWKSANLASVCSVPLVPLVRDEILLKVTNNPTN